MFEVCGSVWSTQGSRDRPRGNRIFAVFITLLLILPYSTIESGTHELTVVFKLFTILQNIMCLKVIHPDEVLIYIYKKNISCCLRSNFSGTPPENSRAFYIFI